MLPDYLKSAARAVVRRLDGWSNVLYGFGSTKDPSSSTVFSRNLTVRTTEFRDLYDQDWLAQRIVDLLPRHALRQKPQIEGLEGKADDLWRAWKALDTARYPEGAFSRALSMGRLLGGHALLLGVNAGGEAAATWAPLEVAPGTTLNWVEECDVEWLQVLEYDLDPASPRFQLPLLYRVSSGPRAGLRLHASKVILCEGRSISPLAAGGVSTGRVDQIFRGWQGWGSVLDPVYLTIANFGISWVAVSTLIKEASMGVLTLKGLIELLATDDKTAVDTRLQLMSTGKSTANTIFLDSDGGESYTRTSVPFTGLPDLMRELRQSVSGAAETPATILFGQSPDGMNATGESDARQYYDRVDLYREQSVSPKLGLILSILAGRPVTLKWESLWSPTPKEQAETRKLDAERDAALVTANIVQPERVLYSRAKDGTLGYEMGDLAALEKAAIEAEKAAAEGEEEPPDPDAEEGADPFARRRAAAREPE